MLTAMVDFLQLKPREIRYFRFVPPHHITLTQSTQRTTFPDIIRLNGRAHSRRIPPITISVSCFQLYAISLQYLAAQILSHGGHSQGQPPILRSSRSAAARRERELCFLSNFMVSIYRAWQPYCHAIIHTRFRIKRCRDILFQVM